MNTKPLLSLLPFFLLSLSSFAETSDRPNVLLLMTDDQGIGQLAYSAEHQDPATFWRPAGTARYALDPEAGLQAAIQAMPNINRLAADGVRFTRAYVASPVCSPSRAAVMTGRYPQRYGIYSNVDAKEGVPRTETFLSELFQEAGYRTAIIGKWHLGKVTREVLPVKTRDYHLNAIFGTVPEHHPLERGFDYYFGFNLSGASYYNSPAIFRNYANIDVPGYLTEAFSREAVRFIETRGDDDPFFLFLSYSAPHIPLHEPAPAHYRNRFDTGNPAADNYYAALAAVDDGVGAILDVLGKRNELANTLIIFVSDNGAVIDSPLPMNGSLRGNKGTLLPGGLQVPLIISWGGRFVPGSVRSQLASGMDILPTALDAAGIELDETLSLDGESLLPVLEDPSESVSPHRFLFWAGPHASHWSPKNRQFWSDYHAYVSGREGRIGDVPKSRFVEAHSPWSLAVTDGTTFIEWQKDDSGEWNPPFYSSGLKRAADDPSSRFFEAALDWLEPLPEPRIWSPEE